MLWFIAFIFTIYCVVKAVASALKSLGSDPVSVQIRLLAPCKYGPGRYVSVRIFLLLFSADPPQHGRNTAHKTARGRRPAAIASASDRCAGSLQVPLGSLRVPCRSTADHARSAATVRSLSCIFRDALPHAQQPRGRPGAGSAPKNPTAFYRYTSCRPIQIEIRPYTGTAPRPDPSAKAGGG